MTCAAYENDLALYVERDLPSADVPAIEAHLRECAECRRFLEDLRTSQSLVHGLAAEPIDEDELANLRERVIAAASSPAPSRGHRASAVLWAAAAAIVVIGISALAWMAKGGQEFRAPQVVQGPSATTAPPRPQRPTRLESTSPTVAAVSPDVDRARVARVRVSRPARVPALSPDDADQLARAVLAVSRISRVHEERPEVDPWPAPERHADPAPLMRVATTDPDVAIYWQLEPSGGE